MDNALIDLLVEEAAKGNKFDDQEDTLGNGVEAYDSSAVDQYFEDVSEVAASMSTQCNQNAMDILGVMASKIEKLAEALTQGDESASAFSDRLYKEVMKIDAYDSKMLDDVFRVLNDNDKLARAFLSRDDNGRRRMVWKVLHESL
ncbi:hypothetical protein NE237_007070 [Protea cynaroides]|uniref:Uncharacterized protein n=1 Tax=Protea cynaroides TaxID=273540 RepID=A0A9Q0KPH0_9MAGN|nr:hypothetical protein NE237_007070 [Protea cynaroides]